MEELGKKLKELQMKTQVLEDVEAYPEFVNMFVEQVTAAEKELKEELKKL